MSDDLQVLLREAETLYEQSEWDQAQEKYIKILQRDPQNEEACYKIARIYAIRGSHFECSEPVLSVDGYSGSKRRA